MSNLINQNTIINLIQSNKLFLMINSILLSKININWNLKDNNDLTPLFYLINSILNNDNFETKLIILNYALNNGGDLNIICKNKTIYKHFVENESLNKENLNCIFRVLSKQHFITLNLNDKNEYQEFMSRNKIGIKLAYFNDSILNFRKDNKNSFYNKVILIKFYFNYLKLNNQKFSTSEKNQILNVLKQTFDNEEDELLIEMSFSLLLNCGGCSISCINYFINIKKVNKNFIKLRLLNFHGKIRNYFYYFGDSDCKYQFKTNFLSINDDFNYLCYITKLNGIFQSKTISNTKLIDNLIVNEDYKTIKEFVSFLKKHKKTYLVEKYCLFKFLSIDTNEKDDVFIKNVISNQNNLFTKKEICSFNTLQINTIILKMIIEIRGDFIKNNTINEKNIKKFDDKIIKLNNHLLKYNLSNLKII